ncbi:MAG: hypothetical protein ACK55I_21725, partial [bacterium]
KKKPTKGVKYIASVLKKYQEKKYPTYNSALPDARKILSEIKSKSGADGRVNIKNIWQYSRKRREKKEDKTPYVHSDLLTADWYFNLKLYPNLIDASSNKVFFISSISPANLPPIQGGTQSDYWQYFSPFVNYINKIVANTDRGRYDAEFNVICTPPVQNPNNGNRWECYIQCIDEYGDQTNYGFDPNNPDAEPDDKEWTPKEPAKEEPAKPTEPSKPIEPEPPKSDADKIRLAELRNEALKMLQDDFKAGIYTKEEYK